MGNTILQIVIFIQVFIAGVLAALAWRHASAHFKPAKLESEAHQPEAEKMYLPPALKENLLQASQAHFQSVLQQTAVQLQKDLADSGIQINSLVKNLAAGIIAGEMERFRLELNRLQAQATTQMGGISDEVAKHQAELKAKIATELEAEKQRLIKQIDIKLGDAVGSFLLEALQHNVDLGSQTTYLISMLEEHKADFIKEVGDEAKAAK